MTKLSNTQTTKFRKASRFSMLALALSLSAGTVVGMFGIAALTSGPVQAQQGGNGGGGSGAEGGAGPSPMAAAKIAAFNPNEPNKDPNRGRGRQAGDNCNGSAEMVETQKCRYNQRSTPRIVRINGFSNCAIVQQVPNPQGGPAEFYCLRPM
ncbi:MAG: hypothetical protein ACOVOC_11780 [Rhabdaerophilum sp.]|jgi:hypothetical protein